VVPFEEIKWSPLRKLAGTLSGNSASVIITSQVKPQGWSSLIEDKVIAEAILDRLMASSQTIDVKGESFRKSQGKKKIDQEEN